MSKTRILIVEDEMIIAEDIKRTLWLLGYEVVDMVSSGKKAIEIAKAKKPDLILMDIMLEGDLTGLEAAKIINIEYKIPIVFLTVYANYNILREAAESNPFGYLLKPFEDRALHATIKMALYKFNMENELRHSKEFLWNVIDAVPDYIFVKDSNQKYILVNKAMSRFFGTSPDKMIGKTDEELMKGRFGNIDSSKAVFETNDVLESKVTSFNAEQYLQLVDGSEKWVQTTRLPLKESDNSQSMLGVSVDITHRRSIEIELQKSYDKMKRILEQTVHGFVLAVEIRDPYTAGHQKRVAMLAERIGIEMGFSGDRLDGLRIASIIHDIGKIYVPAEILNRPGKISDVEFNLIKLHPQNGYDILKSIEFPWPIAEIVYQHHERMDGTGYPRNLSGDEIILEAQILSVADIVEAMMSHRPYRPSLGIDMALGEVISKRGIRYLKEVVDICEKLFRKDGFTFN